ncbi:hypothetical protein NQ314_014494 [Rhamnusium bicolor]|uniref:Nucleotide exchange factor SIL1 n=1 Tax=Rhamnusium bicolor TaxID=1586634 RepID=A0AAV8X2L6_9CUCU|nr:hypothetical protein NQ314_014494 [Rhamnusium bicolor]
MSQTNIIWVLLIILTSQVIGNENKDKEEEDIFIPTREWQVVRKGQKIPKGLHVRINFETGITEAKLLDENETNKNSALQKIPQDGEGDDDKLLNTMVIKEALKKIKNDEILKPDEIKKTNEKFRSYEQLKKDMNSLNLTPKIDAEVLKDLFKQILEDFDFLAHQFDNALEFVNQNGFKQVIYKNLNLSDSQIRQETLRLFGSLVQNNARVQIHALETGGIGTLLRILNLDQSVQVKSRTIYALSCLLRRFPLAQLKFVENGGLSVILKILQKDPAKVQIKLVTLMNDLLTENIQALQDKSNENQSMLVSQYKLVNLEKLLLEQDWCGYLNKLLYLLYIADPDDHDSIEKCILSMHTIASKCAVHYNTDILISLQERYKTLALNDLDRSDEFSNTDFFTNLHDLCEEILHLKNVKTEL